MDENILKLEKILLHHFRDPKLLRCALTHRSSLPDVGANPNDANERLELLGDSVLDLIVVDDIWHRYPNMQEGDLSKLKAMLVSGTALHRVAEELQIGNYIVMSDSEARNGGRKRCSILEDTLEAIIAALYLDGGISAARTFVCKYILCRAEYLTNTEADNNYKSQLLEFAQGRGLQSPHYEIVCERGPDHKKEFEIEVYIGEILSGRGAGNSKKIAQQNAAHDAINRIQSNLLIFIDSKSPIQSDNT